MVFINKQDDVATLYLMHLVARNEHAESAFNIPKEKLEMTDDCLPCIQTNVNGPITCSKITNFHFSIMKIYVNVVLKVNCQNMR